MQTTSETWKSMFSAGARLETKATIAGVDYVEMTNPIITRALMEDSLSIGNAVSAMLDLSIRTTSTIPRASAVQIQMRFNDGETQSEWLPAGTFFIAKRQRDPVAGVVTLECYDAMLRANAVLNEVPWTTDAGEPITTEAGEVITFSTVFPRDPVDLVHDIAILLGVTVDNRTTLQTGSAYTVQAPAYGATIHDVLSIIAAQNGGNWIITPENKLRLVPMVSADDAGEADENVADVVGVTVHIDQRTTAEVTGIRYTADDTPVVLGDDTGLVLDANVGATVANDLYNALAGIEYQAFSLEGAIYDPAAELGDYVRAGANGEIRSMLCAETATLGALFTASASAPEGGELSDEYPYIGGASAKALTAAKVYTDDTAHETVQEAKAYTDDTAQETVQEVKAYTDEEVQALDTSLDQASIFNRLTDNGAAQGLYMVDGQLYVNMSYARAGILVLGGLNNQSGVLQVQDASGNIVGTWDKDGITLYKGSIEGPSVVHGGYNNVDGTLQVLDDDGNTIGTWNNAGISLKGGVIQTFSDDKYYMSEMALSNISFKEKKAIGPGGITAYAQEASIKYHYVNNSGYYKFSIRSENSRIELSAGSNYVIIQNGSETQVNVLSASDINASHNLTVSGTKSRRVITDQYSDRLLYCYETPSPMFGDIGEGVIGEDRLCYVTIDPVFAQTITTDRYQVFLQAYDDGTLLVKKRYSGYFIVQGTPGMAFGWEIKAKQRDFDQRRLDSAQEPYTPEHKDYGAEAAQYIEQLKKEREAA